MVERLLTDILVSAHAKSAHGESAWWTGRSELISFKSNGLRMTLNAPRKFD